MCTFVYILFEKKLKKPEKCKEKFTYCKEKLIEKNRRLW